MLQESLGSLHNFQVLNEALLTRNKNVFNLAKRFLLDNRTHANLFSTTDKPIAVSVQHQDRATFLYKKTCIICSLI